MSIFNLKKNSQYNSFVYCYLNKTIIIKCINFTKLIKIKKDYEYDANFGHYYCDKVEVITIYDNYKNIIYKPIKSEISKKPIKNGVILENLKGKCYFFKTFIGAFIINNKLNNIEYNMGITGFLFSVSYYNNSLFIFPHNYIRITLFNYEKIFSIYNNKNGIGYRFVFYDNNTHIEYHENKYTENKNILIYNIFNDYIRIVRYRDDSEHIIYFNRKNLKIYKLIKCYKNKNINTYELRNNNEVTMIQIYDNKKLIKNFVSNKRNPPFSKTLEKFSTELINNYKKNINHYFEIIKNLLKKKKELYHNLLLNGNLEIQ